MHPYIIPHSKALTFSHATLGFSIIHTKWACSLLRICFSYYRFWPCTLYPPLFIMVLSLYNYHFYVLFFPLGFAFRLISSFFSCLFCLVLLLASIFSFCFSFRFYFVSYSGRLYFTPSSVATRECSRCLWKGTDPFALRGIENFVSATAALR